MRNNKGYKVNIQTKYGSKTFLFKMSRHFTGPDHETMTKIAEWTAKNSDKLDWLVGHLLIYLNGKIARITLNHDLWNLLNRNSQSSERNFLIWRGSIRHDDTITITHFGPMGYRQEFVLLNALTTRNQTRTAK